MSAGPESGQASHIFLPAAGICNPFVFTVFGNRPSGDGDTALSQFFAQQAVAVGPFLIFGIYDFPKRPFDVRCSDGRGVIRVSGIFLDRDLSGEEKVHGIYAPGTLEVLLAYSSADRGLMDVQFLCNVGQLEGGQVGGAVGKEAFLMFQYGFGYLHQGLSSLGHALPHPFRLAYFVAQVFLQLGRIRVAVHLAVVTVNLYIWVHGLIEQYVKMFLEFNNGYVRYDVSEFFPAAEGDAGFGVQ